MNLKTPQLIFLGCTFIFILAAKYSVSLNYSECQDGQILVFRTGAEDKIRCENAPSSGDPVPTNLILLKTSGSCPTGYVEETGLDGKTILGTLDANGNVGTIGGNDNITPTGTISDITGIINHTHIVNINDSGHAHTQRHFPTATGGSTGNTIDTSMSGTQTNSTLTTASTTSGITASSVNPAGGVSSITPTFAGTQFDNRSAFTRVIFCRKI